MRPTPFVFLLVLSSQGLAGDFSWFEGQWISDAQATMTGEEWNRLEESDAVGYEQMTKLFGRLEWRVSGGLIEAQLPGIDAVRVSYAYRPAGDNVVEVLMDDGTVSEVRRTPSGFCVDHGGGTLLARECFKPKPEPRH